MDTSYGRFHPDGSSISNISLRAFTCTPYASRQRLRKSSVDQENQHDVISSVLTAAETYSKLIL
eukprot:6860627-Pyramimonas_sp.AAC.1